MGPTLDLDEIVEGDLQIAPTALILDDGATGFLAAEIIRADGTVLNASSGSLTWSSSAPGVASVSNSGAVQARQPGTAEIVARTASSSATALVVVRPTAADLRPMYDGELSGTVGAALPDSVAVRVVDKGGLPVAGVVVNFTVEDGNGHVSPRTATTAVDGVARARWLLGTSAGSNALRASVSGLGEIYLQARGDANGDEDQLRLIGGNAQIGEVATVLPQDLVVRVVDQYGNPVVNAPIEWHFQDGASADHQGGGGGSDLPLTVAADSEGYASTRWELGQRAGETQARAVLANGSEVWFNAEAMAAAPNTMIIEPTRATLGVGDQMQFEATAIDRFGNRIKNGKLRWRAEDLSVARVQGGGRTTALKSGTTTIVSWIGNLSASATLTVTGASSAPASLRIQSGNGQTGDAGEELDNPLQVRVQDSSGKRLSGVPVSWRVVTGGGSVSASSSDTDGSGVARTRFTLGNSGQLHQVEARVGGLAAVRFSATAQAGGVARIAVTPNSLSLSVNQEQRLYASALDANGNGVSGVTISWSSSNPAIASVDNRGWVTAHSKGSATIRAQGEGQQGTAAVNVGQAVDRVEIAQSNPRINAIGDMVRLNAKAFDKNGNELQGVTFNWTSRNPGVATVDQLGRVVSKGTGAALIAVALGCCQADSVYVDSRQVVAAVNVQPQNPSVDVGSSLQLTATAVDSNGVAVPGLPFSWASTDASVAAVSSAGVVEGRGAGTASVLAQLSSTGGAQGVAVASSGTQGQTTVSVGGSGSNPPPPPPPPSGNGDPELPRTYINTRYQAPSGNTIRVSANGDLQQALNQAQRGDIIKLAPGGVYRGNFTLPAKSGSGWIVVTTDTNLPAEGTRMTPQLASSLNLARIEGSAGWQPALLTAPSASHWRLMGVEITQQDGQKNGGILRLGRGDHNTSNMASHIFIDRSWVHGTTNLDSKRCIELNSAHSAVVDSYVSDCHAVGVATQAVVTWNSPGPIKLANNYLSASGINVLFGGADPSISGLVPSDIEMRGNHLHKPLSWFQSDRWQVKNLFEIKDVRRILVEGNVMENNWRDAQQGRAIVIKSNNQDGGQTWGVAEHMTFRYNLIRNTPAGFVVLRHSTSGHPAGQTNNLLIEHNVIDKLGSNASDAVGSGAGILLVDGPLGVTIRNNVIVATNNILHFDGKPFTDQMVFNDNVATIGKYGIFGGGQGQGSRAINHYIPGSPVQGNVLIGGDPGKYPSGNYFPANPGAVGFVNWGSAQYGLSSGSPFANSGTGGSTPGVNWSSYSQATARAR